MRQSRRTQGCNLPVLSRPLIHSAECPYGVIGRRQRCGRLKVEPINISQMHKVEKTYLECARATQPCGNHPKQSYRVIGPSRRRDHIKIKPVKVKIKRLNDKIAQEDETTHRICVNVMQPPANDPKCCWEVHGSKCQCGRIKFEPRNIS